ncbi:MAG: hypothetical protein L0K74_08830 [Acidipropionibacterium acidipropionici]|nr:hypothetical protein [Acidipropionibacterium acidipropionici]
MNRTRTTTFLPRIILLAALPALGLVGCTPQNDSPPPATSTSRAPSAATSATGDPMGTAYAERRATLDDTAMKLEIFPIRRSGKVATLTAKLTIERATTDVQGFLSPLSRTRAITDPAPAGFTLVAREEGKAYLPAEDSDRHPMCSPTIDSVETGDVIIVSCLFGAPEPSTTAVDVQVVTFGNYHAVPLA